MHNTRAYLDYNATAPLLPQAAEAMVAVWAQPCNASSVHGYGRDARKRLDDARATIAKQLGAEGAQIIFTASGTEANNLAISGLDVANVAVSAVEHPSVLKPAAMRDATIIPVDGHGIVPAKTLEQLLGNMQGRTLVSIQFANNETGVIQPIKELAQVVLKRGGFIHCDATQAIGKLPVNFNDLNVDMLTVSGHKFGAPQGAAALIIKKGLHLKAQTLGGGQESGYRAGTENLAAIVGMAKALETVTPQERSDFAGLQITPQQVRGDIKEVRDHLESEILSIAPNATIFGSSSPRLPNTSCIAMPGMVAETQLINYDLAGVAVSSGSACSSGKVGESHVLKAMGVSKDLAACAIRVSLGRDTTQNDINRFLEVFKKNHRKAICNKEAA